ncbi:MAG: hypothetical protein ACKOJF_26920, partial [Planctomycetaceae bacterium]
ISPAGCSDRRPADGPWKEPSTPYARPHPHPRLQAFVVGMTALANRAADEATTLWAWYDAGAELSGT